MKLVMAAPWNPRGELERFLRLLPALRAAYQALLIILPPHAAPEIFGKISELPDVQVRRIEDWSHGRHAALQAGLSTAAETIHLADFDRLLRWVETQSEEWQTMLHLLEAGDCLISGRSELAYATHPRALVETEATSNAVVSFLLGRKMDVSAGSKVFRREAAEFLFQHSPPGRALGMDGAWPVLLQRGGFSIHYHEVEGLDWESADRYQAAPATRLSQQQAAQAYDQLAESWKMRNGVAAEIITCALEAAQLPLRQDQSKVQ